MFRSQLIEVLTGGIEEENCTTDDGDEVRQEMKSSSVEVFHEDVNEEQDGHLE